MSQVHSDDTPASLPPSNEPKEKPTDEPAEVVDSEGEAGSTSDNPLKPVVAFQEDHEEVDDKKKKKKKKKRHVSISVEGSEVSAPPVEEGEKKEGKLRKMAPIPIHPEYPLNQDALSETFERKNAKRIVEEFGGIDEICTLLKTSVTEGIDVATVPVRQEAFGINEFDKKEPVTFWEFFQEALGDGVIQLLIGCAIVSIIFGLTLPNPHSGETEPETGWIEGTAIILSVAVVTLMGSINNYQKAKKFEEMEQEQAIYEVQVIRNGEERTIKNTELVVGDVYLIEGGMKLTCDGLFLQGSDLKANESAMTGETNIMDKDPLDDPFFLSGTQLDEGDGKMVVVAVGMRSFQGRLKEATTEESGETPLQEHLTELANDIGKLGFLGAFILVFALWIKEGILIGQGKKDFNATAFLNYIIVAVTIIAVAIPEGLPLAVTISLAYSMKSMMADNCLVRVLSSCETMGAATAICSDKTGTLTQNLMSVVQGVIADYEFMFSGCGLIPRNDEVDIISRDEEFSLDIPKHALQKVCTAIALNSTAREAVIDGQLVWVGNKTEHGLLGFVNKCKMNYAEIRDSVPVHMKRMFPFNSQKKRMTTVIKDDFGGAEILVKGASEIILEQCDRYVDDEGAIVPLTYTKREEFATIITNMAIQGNRTLGLAYTEAEYSELPEEEPENVKYIFMGVLGIQDPIRSEVPEAVKRCGEAGITVRMVTGDNINTAIAIAKKCNIYEENGWDKAMTGEDFRNLYVENRQEALNIVPRLRVLARSSPNDKYVLVGLLQEIGEVVGVTGDGTNDAPALKLANVGFAMQIGTDIAKGAADMVLLDNNFASVVNAVKWGRAVNDNIRKFLQYQLSINAAGVFLTIVGSLASETSKEPFAPVQLLWLNLIMDTMAALALATEHPDESCLTRLPVFKQAALISKKMWTFISVHAVFQSTVILIILFTGHKWLNTVEDRDTCDHNYPLVSGPNGTMVIHPTRAYCEKLCEDEGGVIDENTCQQGTLHSTIIFNTFIFFQAFNIFNARKLYSEYNPFEGIWSRSKIFIGVVLMIVLFQVFAVEVGGKFLETHGLRWDYWLICVGLGFSEWFVGVFVRLLPVHDQPPEEVQQKWDREKFLKEQAGFRQQRRSIGGGETVKLVKKDPSLKRASTIHKARN